jgi:ATP adenylyltransferase
MDYLWSPWRYRYVSQAGKGTGCPFCQKIDLKPEQDREHLVLYRGRSNFILLNLYPYTTGHMLVTPYAHVATLDGVPAQTLVEMMELAQRLQTALKQIYNAGAGVADHIHMHLLPRWGGDTNFMTVVAETRVQPEDLLATYDKLAAFFPRSH